MSLVIGLMSGTSMDGIDACLVEISSSHDGSYQEEDVQMKLLQFLTVPYPPAVREGLLALCSGTGESAVLSDVSQYNFLLGQLFAQVAHEVVDKSGHSMNDITVIGSHGQTVCHHPSFKLFHGFQVSSTLQLADPSVIANRCGVTTVGDFRVADIALGGQGAPLVPYLDKTILQNHCKSKGRIGLLLNIGGISNITVLIPSSQELIGFDCGPGNVLIDSLMTRWYQEEYDKNGERALKGSVSKILLDSLLMMNTKYRERSPPKSLGKEEYGEEYLELVEKHVQNGLTKEDAIATITEFTVKMVAESCEKFIMQKLNQESTRPEIDLFVSGGGAHNRAIMRWLGERLGVRVSTTADIGVDPNAKEAMCFALLAYQTMNNIPTNIPSVTGASKYTLLGKICPVLPNKN